MKTHSPIYAFDNYFGDSPLARDPAAQSALLKSLGYGATYHSMNRKTEEGWKTFLTWEESSRHGGLPVIGYYTMLELGKEPPEGGHSAEEVIEHLPSGSVFELAIMMAGSQASDASRDAEVIAVLRPLVDLARSRGVTISLYHHIWFLLERIEDCVRVAEKINDPALRVTFCGYHWYAVDGSELTAKVKLAAPWMCLANLCGSRSAPVDAKFAGCLPKTIESLGEGDFPLAEFIHALTDVGYSGPVGFQGYKIGGHPPETLATSIEAWRNA
ncbi:MAG: sugar phosphate isomerase/epimerase family protein [Spartobacteria bacterium]